MTKGLRKAMFLCDKTETFQKEYKKQRNFCVNLLEKAHFANLDLNSVLDNRKF